ncbi:multidrug efflux pump subunit AcrA (membrane-fusion protein) [Pseudomonas sp. 3296]|uniref:HlyD family efflux transporter periplasmic adaptor subunit n=1 Tax=Pseudomonas sp. 3296 TaxID=2817753 RepID=UPI002860FEE4|nr:HlyD family efflux transporter periplasmic adaptor subunit [Pseudomonas sp. 3296]MDR6919080.1 multidrug efflux pump subunit AcrA (membrane-fusion protein) [Pseudomonas sp. 3296]
MTLKQLLAPAKVFIVLAVLLLALSVAWARVTNIDETVHALGRVISAEGIQTIQAADPGQIATVFVREGQIVAKGERLVSMQSTRATASFEDSKSKVAALTAALARLRAEMFDRPLDFPESLSASPEFVNNQTELFRARRRSLEQGLSALSVSLRLAQDELAVVQPLFDQGDIGKAEVLRLQRQKADLQGQIVNLRNKYFQDAQTEMTKVEEELATREQEFADRAEVLRNTEIVAPKSGVVRNINILTEGANVNRGDVIMELVPSESALSFEAKLRSADVAFVRVGAPATIKLDAYDYSIYGMLQGEVDFVSPDALTEKTARGEEVFYRVRVHVVGRDKRSRDLELQPGMTGQIDIRTGAHSLLSYLTKPITKTLAEALNER